ncbi:radical SAM protein [Chloroflexota bacterium]
MKKKFAFLKFHVIEDHKHTNSVDNLDFYKNPVMLKTDRFLEKELRDKIQLGQRRPYTLVVDTAGCNKNCWFCYAYPIIKKQDYDKCQTIYLSPEELTKCFVEKLSSIKKDVRSKDRFFSKLRITGGEPLFSDRDTLIESQGEDYPFETINYFLKFFEFLDTHIDRLISERVISLSIPKVYSTSDHDVHFPTFLCTNDNRIEIRFDTNGFLFANLSFAEKFIGGIYNLFDANKLNNLLIKIDYSLKGAYPLEVLWSQNQELPVEKNRLKDFKIEEHPQYTGLKNISNLMQKFSQKNPHFGSCFGITVEPGINNVKRNFMYYEGSLNWVLLEWKLKAILGSSFKLSDVDNKMEVRGKIYTHHKRGIAIKLIYDNKEFLISPSDGKEKIKELQNLKSKSGDNYKIIYIPFDLPPNN